MNWSPDSSDGAVRVNTPTREALLADIAERLAAGRGFTVATLNLDHAVKLRRDSAFREAYARHSHVVADGNPVVWLSRLAGQDARLVPGSDLINPVAALAAERQTPVVLVGGTETSLARAAEGLERRHPGLRIVARIAPPMGFDPSGPTADAMVEALAASEARLCFLALGAPRQEIFAIHAARQLPQVGFLSIGAGLDFAAGAQVRAPALVRAVAAEWLWRLAADPRRLGRRYAACLALLPALVGAALRTRRQRIPEAASD